MRKWGLHYFFYLMVLAMVLAGCGAADNKNSADNSAAAVMDSGADGGAAESAAESAALEAGETEMKSTVAAPAKQDMVAAGDGKAADTTLNADAQKASEGASGFTGSDVVAGLNKKLIYRANLIMEVTDYAAAQTEVRNMVTLANGYIIEFTENMSEYEQGGTFILKVPASGFSSFLNSLEKVKHENLQRSIQGTDVSEEYVDLESRLKAKQLMENQYIEFMKKATKSSDLVSFANQLGAIQEEIERIKGRMRYIDQNVSFSTVELRLYQTDESVVNTQKKEQGPLGERASDALQGSMNAISVMFQWLVVVVAGALPVLIVLGLIAGIVLFLRKQIKQRDTERIERIRQANRELKREQPNPGTDTDNHAAVEEDHRETEK